MIVFDNISKCVYATVSSETVKVSMVYDTARFMISLFKNYKLSIGHLPNFYINTGKFNVGTSIQKMYKKNVHIDIAHAPEY